MKGKVIAVGLAGLITFGGAVGVTAMWDSNTEQAKDDKLTIGQAQQIAATETGGTPTSIELEEDDGRVYYEVEVDDKNGDDDVEIDAASGKVLEVDDDQQASNQDRISQEEAIAIATKDTPGKVTEIELDDDHYEIEIKNNGQETDLDIHAFTGEILKKDVDREDD
ncbi:MAG TPA: PepSY domain-containing protein [Chondromyces sp.]|nr:PepSY domain-containing protein [Chondromyces sp.]